MVNRFVKMLSALVFAGVLAGASATLLGLVDAGHEMDDLFARLDSEAAALHRAGSASVQHGAPADPITRPRNSLQKAFETLGPTADRIVDQTAPSYARWAAQPLSTAIDLVPPGDPLKRALADYVDQLSQAQADKARTESAIKLRARLLDLSYEGLLQKIGEARTRTRTGSSRALTGVYAITLASIAIAAFVVGRSE